MLARSVFEWSRATPDQIALTYNGENWSYRVFADAIARARGRFHRRGIVGEGIAVVALTHLREFWVQSLALRSLGLTTIAIQSPDVIARLGLPGVRCVVASAAEAWPGLVEACARLRLELVELAADAEAPLGLEATEHPEGGHILQTSGTTGAYKLVLIDPAFEPEYMRRRRAFNRIRQSSVVCVFEFGGWTGVGYKSPATTWYAGGSVVFGQGLQPHLLLNHPGLTEATLVPAMLAEVLAQPDDAYPRNETMQLSVTGGSITQTQIDEAKRRITPRLYNGLGATESHAIAFTRLDTPDDHRWQTLAPGTIVELVDEFDRPVPVGQVGRIRVGTEGGPTGYLYDEEATKAFFRNGFFYPGDLAVMREDGRIALQGRVTEVINVRGQKLSPGPIEQRLREAFGISGVCLLSMQDEHGEEELHLVIESAAPLEGERLARTLQSELQGFPGVHVHYTPALARNDMGKVLRQAVVAGILAARSASGRAKA